MDIFILLYPFSPLSPSLWETARYRLKYCLKGPLNPKQPTNQPLQNPLQSKAEIILQEGSLGDSTLRPEGPSLSSETEITGGFCSTILQIPPYVRGTMLILTNRVPAIRRYEEISYATRVSNWWGNGTIVFLCPITYHLFQTSDRLKVQLLSISRAA